MSRTEQFYITMPESHPTANEGKRVAPNEGNFPVDAVVNVFTDDDHLLTFRMFKKGPFEKEYLIALVDAKAAVFVSWQRTSEVCFVDEKKYWLFAAEGFFGNKFISVAGILSTINND